MRLSRRHLPSESATPQPSGSSRRAPATLPPYEHQVAELNATAKRSVQALINNLSVRRLNAHLEHAQQALVDTAGGINDALGDAWGRYEKGVRKRREGRRGSVGDVEEGDGEDEEARRRVEELERRVKEVTEKMEERMRQVVDMRVRTETLVDVLRKIGEEDEGVQSQRRNSGMRRRTRRQAEGDEEGGSEDGNESQDERHDEQPEFSASQMFENTLMENKRSWEAMSLTQRYFTSSFTLRRAHSLISARYTTHNDYINFYRVVHDSRNRNEDNTTRPLPHSSTWFSHMEEPPTQTPTQPEACESSRSRSNKRRHTRRQVEDDDDGDVEIDSERISLKCPITLLPLRDPVTSIKCPHSFEREAIEQMIRNSGTYPSARSNLPRKKHVQCPVCTVQLSLEDVRSDPVLARRVRRANERAAREDDDDGDIDDGENDDVMLETEGRRKRRNVEVKQERVRSPSRVPDTQFDAVSGGDEHSESELSAADMEAGEDDECMSG